MEFFSTNILSVREGLYMVHPDDPIQDRGCYNYGQVCDHNQCDHKLSVLGFTIGRLNKKESDHTCVTINEVFVC